MKKQPLAVPLTETALYYFNTGNSADAYKLFGTHPAHDGWRFAVWAPSAKAVHISGSFNNYNPTEFPMRQIGNTGVWQAVLSTVSRGDYYKYVITGEDGNSYWRADPYATRTEYPPGKASMVWGIPDHRWSDTAYYKGRKGKNIYQEPMSVYEVHLGSFIEGLSYREMAKEVVGYAAHMGYTHIELLPLCEYPLPMSWGYQITGYYAATARYGPPEDLMYFVDCAHKQGLGVILDWVPAHFPKDEHGLRQFDGKPLYENTDVKRSEQPQWGTLLFDYGRTQVQSFLLSNAFYWLKEFHFDGLRVDAVSCMLYYDYGREAGDWAANEYGGNENLDAIAFIKKLSTRIREEWPQGGRLLIAEESTAFPSVTRPTQEGGLGFHFKWNMGFMNDTLAYMEKDPVHRKWHHNKLTFSLAYAFSEQYILPYSHDEVVHGKHSLLDKMPGDYWRKFAQLRLLLSFQYAHPGKKLNFMGNEFGQFIEWKFDQSLDWLLLDYPKHKEMQDFSRALNHFYKDTPALYEQDTGWEGFSWVSVDDCIHSVAIFIRWGKNDALLCAFNFTPNPWRDYKITLPIPCVLKEVFSSDEARFGGTGEWHNPSVLEFDREGHIALPPLGGTFFEILDISPINEQAVGT